jgi:predicted secreted protein
MTETESGTAARMGARIPVLWIALVAGAAAALVVFGPLGAVARAVTVAFAMVALVVFGLTPPDLWTGRRQRPSVTIHGLVSAALGVLAAVAVFLAIESRAVVMSVALYFVLWWVFLFAVLPFGVRSQHDANDIEPGSDPGAPVRPLMLRKVLATSAVAAVVLILVQLFLIFRPIPNVLPF